MMSSLCLLYIRVPLVLVALYCPTAFACAPLLYSFALCTCSACSTCCDVSYFSTSACFGPTADMRKGGGGDA